LEGVSVPDVTDRAGNVLAAEHRERQRIVNPDVIQRDPTCRGRSGRNGRRWGFWEGAAGETTAPAGPVGTVGPTLTALPRRPRPDIAFCAGPARGRL
jgi:hypothetical protein